MKKHGGSSTTSSGRTSSQHQQNHSAKGRKPKGCEVQRSHRTHSQSAKPTKTATEGAVVKQAKDKDSCLQQVPNCTNSNAQGKENVPRRRDPPCPVDMQTEEVNLSAAEKEARVNEMESEFMKRRKLIISGLPPESNHENLSSFFSELSCLPITRVKDGTVRVVFPNHNAASDALALLNCTVLNYHQLSASYGHPDSLLFVGNLPLTFTREDLAHLFRPYGDILRCLVVYSPKTGLHKGYGFIEFILREEALLAKQHMATQVVGLRSLRVDFADNGMQMCEDLHSETLFVDRLSKGFHDDSKLKGVFAKYGSVNFCQIALAAGTGASRGFAFVDMGSSQEAECAQSALSGAIFAGQEIRVSFGMPCRHGACILQHKSTPVPHNILNRPLLPTFPENLQPPHHMFLHGMPLQGRSVSERDIRSKPCPLGDITNAQSTHTGSGATMVLHLRKTASLTHLNTPQNLPGHSLYPPSIISRYDSHGNISYDSHGNISSPSHYATPEKMEENSSNGTSQDVCPLQDGGSSISEQHHLSQWVGKTEEGSSEECPMPPRRNSLLPQPHMTHEVQLAMMDHSLLGKRHASKEETLPVHDEGMGWGYDCVYDVPYIGQHQQGIPFTHPLKRIRMEQC